MYLRIFIFADVFAQLLIYLLIYLFNAHGHMAPATLMGRPGNGFCIPELTLGTICQICF